MPADVRPKIRTSHSCRRCRSSIYSAALHLVHRQQSCRAKAAPPNIEPQTAKGRGRREATAENEVNGNIEQGMSNSEGIAESCRFSRRGKVGSESRHYISQALELPTVYIPLSTISSSFTTPYSTFDIQLPHPSSSSLRSMISFSFSSRYSPGCAVKLTGPSVSATSSQRYPCLR